VRPIKKFVLVVTPFGLAACATVWGFEDAIERGGDGTADGGGPIATGEVTPSNVAGVFCAPRPPEGWIGPLSVAEVTGAPLPPIAQCSERWELAFEANANITVPDAGCGCDCDTAGVKECAAPSATLFSEAMCNSACGAAQTVPSYPYKTCAQFDAGTALCPSTADVWIKAGSAAPTGTCEPKSKGPPAPPTWLTGARLCRPKPDVAADCGDKAIAPQTPVGFDTNNYCVLATRPDECPSTYPRKRNYFEANKFSEERSCEACSCGPPTGKCAGALQTGDSTSATPADCAGGYKNLDLPLTACTKIGKQRVWSYDHADAAAENVQCAPSGGAILGKVVPATTLTVCCRL
jgi:hypothetical protein